MNSVAKSHNNFLLQYVIEVRANSVTYIQLPVTSLTVVKVYISPQFCSKILLFCKVGDTIWYMTRAFFSFATCVFVLLPSKAIFINQVATKTDATKMLAAVLHIPTRLISLGYHHHDEKYHVKFILYQRYYQFTKRWRWLKYTRDKHNLGNIKRMTRLRTQAMHYLLKGNDR